MPLHGLHVVFVHTLTKSVNRGKIGQNRYLARVASQNEINTKFIFKHIHIRTQPWFLSFEEIQIKTETNLEFEREQIFNENSHI